MELFLKKKKRSYQCQAESIYLGYLEARIFKTVCSGGSGNGSDGDGGGGIKKKWQKTDKMKTISTTLYVFKSIVHCASGI